MIFQILNMWSSYVIKIYISYLDCDGISIHRGIITKIVPLSATINFVVLNFIFVMQNLTLF